MKRQRDSERTELVRIRCAVYTRKSTEENLDTEFNSLDAQREAAEAYVASLRYEGWVAGGGDVRPISPPALPAGRGRFPGRRASRALCWRPSPLR